MAQGEYFIEIFVNDSAGNINNTCSLTLYKDTLAPYIIINYPSNHTAWKDPPLINVTAIDPNLDDIWYKVGSSNNIALTDNVEQPLASTIWNNLPEGSTIAYLVDRLKKRDEKNDST